MKGVKGVKGKEIKVGARLFRFLTIALTIVFFSVSCLYAAEDKLVKRINSSTEVFEEIMQMPEQAIPESVLKKCAGVAIFPRVIKVAFGFGGRGGRGVILRRDKKTGKWSAPAFYSIGGGSFGWQIGVQAIDLILVIVNEWGMEELLSDKFTLGGDVAVAVGPVGRDAEASTDIFMKASIFSYSRTKGLFAGIAFKGAVIKPDRNANESFYGEKITPGEILYESKVKMPDAAKSLVEVLTEHIPK